MTEGTQNTAKPAKKPSLLLIAGGTLGAIAIAVFASQFLRPEEAQATGETSGKATVSGNARTNAVARVDSKYITYEEVAKEAFARIGSEVLDSMINRLIIQREVEKRGIVITEADVHQEVVKISKRFNLPTDTWYQMLQTERNLSPEQYRRDVIWPMIALRKLAGESIDVSPEDMQEAFVRDYGPRVRCRMILMDNFRRANDVWQQASAADLTNFEKLARDNSIDPSSRALGGSIPPISRHSGNKALEDAAFRLKAGEVSGLIQVATNRYAILYCEGQTEQLVTNPQDVQTELYEQLVEEKTQMKVAEVFQQLRDTTRVDNYLTNTTTGSKKPANPYPNGIQPTSAEVPGTSPFQR